MRVQALTLAVAASFVSACTDDLDAPYNYLQTTGDATGGDTPMVDCDAIPAAAVAADFSHVLTVAGGEMPYSFASSNLPPGLTLDTDGTLAGTPTQAGDASFDITVTDAGGVAGTTTCQLSIADQISVELALDTVPYCLTGTDTLLAHVVPGTGDGTPITCDHPGGSGNGTMPAGISVDPETCALTGTVQDTRLGTWAFIVRGTQAGAEVFIPYCATNDTPAAGTFALEVDHTGATAQTLVPLMRLFNPDASIMVGAPGDPLFRAEAGDACPGNVCSYSFSFFINASPFDLQDGAGNDKAVIVDDMLASDADGYFMTHGLELSTNTPVADAFKNRPWVVNLAIDYCFDVDGNNCDTSMTPTFDGFLEWSVIMVPQG